MSEHDGPGVPEAPDAGGGGGGGGSSVGGAARGVGVSNEFSGEAASAVQAGTIGELNIYHSPAPPPPADSPVAVTCEVEADYLIQRGWADGVPLSGGHVRVFVEACEDRAVLLRALRPVVVSRRPPIDGTETMHWGVPQVRKYTVDFDKDPPRLKGPRFLYTVAPGDPEVFELTVHCDRYDVEWRLELDWTCAGRSGTSVVDLGGHPFRFTAKPRGRRWSRGTRR
ncbi:hypothetical protein ACIQWA_10790 [Kitasatospora sp. NPDC098652]|uniref:hypothetical protein n=1 Tax=Kitasatospora sp. NPDC098652 TaxID=3364095 RepID=UPI00380ADB3B